MKTFLVTVETDNLEQEWEYKPKQKIIIPVKSSTAYHAQTKLKNKYAGSEYPNYRVVSVVACDDCLFKPIL